MVIHELFRSISSLESYALTMSDKPSYIGARISAKKIFPERNGIKPAIILIDSCRSGRALLLVIPRARGIIIIRNNKVPEAAEKINDNVAFFVCLMTIISESVGYCSLRLRLVTDRPYVCLFLAESTINIERVSHALGPYCRITV